MSENLDQKDKIIINAEDSPDFQDHFSRLAPGDKVKGDFEATLDEAGQKLVTLSIDKITIKDAAEITKGGEGGEGDEEPAGVTVTKDENGTPNQEGAEEVPETLTR